MPLHPQLRRGNAGPRAFVRPEPLPEVRPVLHPTIMEWIAAEVLARGWSQRRFAIECGLPISTVREWLNHRGSEPRVEGLEAALRVLGAWPPRLPPGAERI